MSSTSQPSENADATQDLSPATPAASPEPVAETAGAPSMMQPGEQTEQPADVTPTLSQPPAPEVFPGQMPAQGYPTGQMPYPGYPPTMPPSQPYPPQGYAGAPSQPYFPQGYPGTPSQPYFPQGYPGTPSQPYFPPGYPGAPSQPYYPGQPMPTQSWQGYPTGQMPWPDPAGGVATLAPAPAKSAGLSALAQPLPLWAILAGSVIVVLVPVGLALMGKDWADGATHVGIAAGALAAMIILATGIRSAAGMAAKTNEHRRAQYIGATLVTVLFLALGGAGIGLQTSLHHLQAGALASNQQWQQAINELQLAGEAPPASEALAQVYNEWGEHLSNSQQYQAASDKLFIVLDTYSAATQGVKRAQADIITTYIAWGKHDMQQQHYQDATRQFDSTLIQPYCLADCQSQVNALDATAYYNLAEADLSAQKYTDAINAFSVIALRFASSPEALKIHGDYAIAFYQAGQQDIADASTCSAAIPLYQQLTKDFADTPQAKLAATALAAPQAVKGQFPSGPPANTVGVVTLLKNARINLKTQDFVGTPTVVANALIKSDGSFAFTPVAQGTYSLAWQTIDKKGNITSFSFYYTSATGDPYYVATVGQLCPFDFGLLDEPVYSPPTGNVVIKQENVVTTVLAGHKQFITVIGVTSSRQRRSVGDR